MKILFNKTIYALCLWSGMILMGCGTEQSKTSDRLPILGRREAVEKKDADGNTITDTIYHTITDFAFTGQDSSTITNESFKDKIYIADFFFTSCQTICPPMKAQMLRVHDFIADKPEIEILSHTLDPEHDSIPVLKAFAERLGANPDKWHFVTGDKNEIYRVGQSSYLVTAREDSSEPGGYLHDARFVLVDKDRRIRGIYDGTKPDHVDRLMADLPKLLKEYHTTAP